jgi:hypothetical protein
LLWQCDLEAPNGGLEAIAVALVEAKSSSVLHRRTPPKCCNNAELWVCEGLHGMGSTIDWLIQAICDTWMT